MVDRDPKLIDSKDLGVTANTERAQIEIPKDGRGRIKWSVLRQNPENLLYAIESETKRLVDQGIDLSSKGLIKAKSSTLSSVIAKDYPEGYHGLRAKMNLPTGRKPRNYWIPENILKEAKDFYDQFGSLTQSLLVENNRHDLFHGIWDKYPGGFNQLQQDLDIETTRKSPGYWTEEQIREEAKAFFEEYGILMHSFLKKKARGDLEGALYSYPGNLRQLQIDIGAKSQRKPDGYWSEEKIREEAKAFLEQYGVLTESLLRENKRRDLLNAISSYPGSLRQLQYDIGTESPRKPNGYWTPENTEKEALEFVRVHGFINQRLLRQYKYTCLINAAAHYPGGLETLRKKIGLESPKNSLISPDDADEELGRLIAE